MIAETTRGWRDHAEENCWCRPQASGCPCGGEECDDDEVIFMHRNPMIVADDRPRMTVYSS